MLSCLKIATKEFSGNLLADLIRTPYRRMPLTIYLDQCAASVIARDPDCAGMRDFLLRGADCGTVFCPLPFDTIFETSRCERAETREAIFSFFKAASGGLIFRQFFDILADSVLFIVRNDHHVSGFDHTWEMDRLRDLSAEIGPDFDELRNERNANLSSWVDPPRPSGMSFNEVLENVSLEPVARLWRDLRQIASSSDIQSLSEFDCPRITESLLKNHITAEEADELAEKLRHHAMDAIPIQFFHNRLAAAGSHLLLQRQEAKLDYNDIIDQERISVALAFSDFAVTDRSMADRVERSGVKDVSECNVFKVGDLVEFERALTARHSP